MGQSTPAGLSGDCRHGRKSRNHQGAQYRKMRSQRLSRWDRWLRGRLRATRVAAVAVATLTALPLSSAISADASTRLTVDIAPQSLEAALVELCKQGHMQLVIATDSLPAKTSGSLHGSMPLGEALDQLLKDTGLTYRLAGDRTIAIVKAAAPRQRSDPPHSPGVVGESSVVSPR